MYLEKPRKVDLRKYLYSQLTFCLFKEKANLKLIRVLIKMEHRQGIPRYEVLLISKDPSTIRIIKSYFDVKMFKKKIFVTGVTFKSINMCFYLRWRSIKNFQPTSPQTLLPTL